MLTDAEWRVRLPGDGRTVGVIVHHVGFVYPIEIDISRPLAKGEPLTGVTMDDVHAMNAKHAIDYAAVTKEQAIELVRTNSAAAAAAGRSSGSVTRRNVGQVPAPAMEEASSRRGSIDCIAADINRYASGVISRDCTHTIPQNE